MAAYARVSTDSEEQETSYDAQIKYYTNYIKSRADWEFVKMYSDKAVTGTNTKQRKGFTEMIDDALAGKDRPYHHKVGQPFFQEHGRLLGNHPKAEGAGY
jgi:DNA invertase Pin-like site-specific DNA recombinase